VEQLAAWVKEAPDKTAYQRRLAIWLTHAGPFAAHRVADLLAVSTQAVWKWVAEYNTLGPNGLDRKGRGGRRWGLMSLDEERAFLAEHLAQAASGDLLTAKQLASALAKKLGQEVSIDYIYGLLHRHEWRKLTPRPHHAKQAPAIMEAFKKTPANAQNHSPEPSREYSDALTVPANMKLLPPPPDSPELNLAEHVWEYIRENDIRNQIFNTLDEVMDTIETSLRHLHEAPEELRSMTAFPWIFEKAA
jgi:transposase